ncbi:hypothetical protein B0H14DRAFT_3494400 [Mycena olivaceomarginata]|nr:hypothetical protein B0H14DRAFT_3494400 [Mycena olivaceomarginata]
MHTARASLISSPSGTGPSAILAGEIVPTASSSAQYREDVPTDPGTACHRVAADKYYSTDTAATWGASLATVYKFIYSLPFVLPPALASLRFASFMALPPLAPVGKYKSTAGVCEAGKARGADTVPTTVGRGGVGVGVHSAHSTMSAAARTIPLPTQQTRRAAGGQSGSPACSAPSTWSRDLLVILRDGPENGVVGACSHSFSNLLPTTTSLASPAAWSVLDSALPVQISNSPRRLCLSRLLEASARFFFTTLIAISNAPRAPPPPRARPSPPDKDKSTSEKAASDKGPQPLHIGLLWFLPSGPKLATMVPHRGTLRAEQFSVAQMPDTLSAPPPPPPLKSNCAFHIRSISDLYTTCCSVTLYRHTNFGRFLPRLHAPPPFRWYGWTDGDGWDEAAAATGTAPAATHDGRHGRRRGKPVSCEHNVLTGDGARRQPGPVTAVAHASKTECGYSELFERRTQAQKTVLAKTDLHTLDVVVLGQGQAHALCDMSVHDNVVLGRHAGGVGRAEVEAACARVRMHEFVCGLLEGYDWDQCVHEDLQTNSPRLTLM